MFPLVGPAVMSGVNLLNDNGTTIAISTSPAVSMLEADDAHIVLASVRRVVGREGRKHATVRTRHAHNRRLATAFRLARLGGRLGYAAGVAEGRIDPANELDYLRGLATERLPMINDKA